MGFAEDKVGAFLSDIRPEVKAAYEEGLAAGVRHPGVLCKVKGSILADDAFDYEIAWLDPAGECGALGRFLDELGTSDDDVRVLVLDLGGTCHCLNIPLAVLED
jgi:hypothetical protein